MKNKKVINEEEAILSGYVRYMPINKTYYLMVNSKRLSTHLSKIDKKNNVSVSRKDNFFIINKNEEGNILKPRRRELVTCISGNILLSDTEKIKLISKESKFSFPVKVKLIPGEFKLDKFSLYPDQDAAKLGRVLASKGMEISSRIMTPKAFDHDLEFIYKTKKVIIEITQTVPGKANNLNFKHQPLGGSIRAHIFDIYRECVNSKLTGSNNNVGIIIIHKNWKNYAHIINLVSELEKINCFIIFTNFGEDWANHCSDYILERLGINPHLSAFTKS